MSHIELESDLQPAVRIGSYTELAEEIKSQARKIVAPETELGKEIIERLFKNPFFQDYPRSKPICSSIVRLIEIEEKKAAKGNEKDAKFYQLAHIGAFFEIFRTALTNPEPGEKGDGSKYQPLYNSINLELHGLDVLITHGDGVPRISDKLAAIFEQGVVSLNQNFDISLQSTNLHETFSNYFSERDPHPSFVDAA